MFKLFNRTPKKPVIIPPSPCGNDKEHYYWTQVEKWPCPVCNSMERRKQKLADEERKTKILAKAIVDELQQRGLALPIDKS